MKKIIYLLTCVGATSFFTGCSSPKLLYSWSNYDRTSFTYLKKGDDKSRENVLKSYQQIIKKQEGTRKTVPPGIYADWGFILLQTGKIEEGKEMMNKEISLYPESKVFIENILKMFNQ